MNVFGFLLALEHAPHVQRLPDDRVLLLRLVVCAYQGMRVGFTGWLYARATRARLAGDPRVHRRVRRE